MSAPSTAKRRYLWRLGISMGIYLVSLLGANYLIDGGMVSGPLTWVLAIIPGLAAAGVFYAVGMLIVEQEDEFIRMLIVRQSLIATGFALSIATVWGFLEDFGLVEHAAGYWALFMWCIGLALGGLVNRITHGTWGNCW